MRHTWLQAIFVYIAFFFSAIVSVFVAKQVLKLPGYTHEIGLIVQPLLLLLLLLPLYRRQQLPRIHVGLERPRLLLWGLPIGVGLWIAKWCISNLINAAAQYFSGADIRYTSAVLNWGCEFPAADIAERARLIVTIPIIEEICFRGLILALFLAKGRPLLGFVVATTAFAAYHDTFWDTFIIGGLFGLLYWYTRHLGLAIVAHMLHNFLVTINHYCLHIQWTPAPIWWLVGLLLTLGSVAGIGWLTLKTPDKRERWHQA